MKSIILASRNPGKISEFNLLIKDLPLQIIPADEIGQVPNIAETGKTFAENARLKAETLAKFLCMPALGDDSGLEVEYLNGAPGIYSARYAGDTADDEQNNRKLLKALEGVPEHLRGARFCCCIALAEPGHKTRTAAGECYGRIAAKPWGGGGFGYDPLFICEQTGLTFAEMSAEEKNRISHRGKALSNIRRIIMEMLEDE